MHFFSSPDCVTAASQDAGTSWHCLVPSSPHYSLCFRLRLLVWDAPCNPASHSPLQNKHGWPPPSLMLGAPGGCAPQPHAGGPRGLCPSPSTLGPFQQHWGSVGDAAAEPQLLIALRSIRGCSQLIRLISPFVKLFMSTNICCSNHHSPLTHDHISGSPRNLQLSPARLAQRSLSALHVQKSIRGSRCAVNVDGAYITKSETSVTMVTLEARLISRINYDKKLSMAVFKQ